MVSFKSKNDSNSSGTLFPFIIRCRVLIKYWYLINDIRSKFTVAAFWASTLFTASVNDSESSSIEYGFVRYLITP